jgi:predicted glycoside hydrolase/deacetylase ChbG (UPF0249 family)
LLKEKETMERNFLSTHFHVHKFPEVVKVLANLLMRLAQQVSLCSGKNKRYCSGGAINKLLEDENRRLITRANLAHESLVDELCSLPSLTLCAAFGQP